MFLHVVPSNATQGAVAVMPVSACTLIELSQEEKLVGIRSEDAAAECE